MPVAEWSCCDNNYPDRTGARVAINRIGIPVIFRCCPDEYECQSWQPHREMPWVIGVSKHPWLAWFIALPGNGTKSTLQSLPNHDAQALHFTGKYLQTVPVADGGLRWCPCLYSGKRSASGHSVIPFTASISPPVRSEIGAGGPDIRPVCAVLENRFSCTAQHVRILPVAQYRAAFLLPQTFPCQRYRKKAGRGDMARLGPMLPGVFFKLSNARVCQQRSGADSRHEPDA